MVAINNTDSINGDIRNNAPTEISARSLFLCPWILCDEHVYEPCAYFLFLVQEETYLTRVKELDEVTSERDQKRREHEAMRKQRLDEFMAGFSVITTKLKEMYQVN